MFAASTVKRAHLCCSFASLKRPRVPLREFPKQVREIAVMGSFWSSEPKASSAETIAIEKTTIHSAPSAKFADSMDLSFEFDENGLRALQKHGKKGSWHVELEIDVAYTQARHALAIAEANLQERVHRVHIPSSAFRKVTEESEVTVDNLCNICAVHAGLHVNEREGDALADSTVVLDVSNGGDDSASRAESLVRRVYGIFDASGVVR